MGEAAVELDLECVGARGRERQIEDQHGRGLDVCHPGRRLAEMHRALPLEQGGAPVVHEPDADGMLADFGPASPDPEDQVGPGMHRGEAGNPDVLEEPQHGELALLVDQGVIGEDSEVEMQVRRPGSR
jgi:hypothetical protein